MKRQKKEITPAQVKVEGSLFVIYVRHPILKKIVRIPLGDAGDYIFGLQSFNRIWLDETLWLAPPPTTPERIRRAWCGSGEVVKLRGDKVLDANNNPLQASEIARIKAEHTELLKSYAHLVRQFEQQSRELEALRGKKYSRQPSQTLRAAFDAWFTRWAGRKDSEYAKTVKWDLNVFLKHFGENTHLDALEGREGDIDSWLQNMKTRQGKAVSGSRAMQVRVYVLKFLSESGCGLDRAKITRVKSKDIKKGRGAIKWLTLAQANKVASKLAAPFNDVFRIQVAVGLRPDEMLTLHHSNFNESFSRLTLAPLDGLTLKTGPRVIPIPEHIRPILQFRAQQCPVLFPEPPGAVSRHSRTTPRKNIGPAEGGKAWRDPKMFNRRYRDALAAAAAAAGVRMDMDSRIGRRTCASLLLQDNVSAEKIAALLGNTPAMILDHYGDPDLENLDLSKTAVGVKTGA
jgi:hypothetical protein